MKKKQFCRRVAAVFMVPMLILSLGLSVYAEEEVQPQIEPDEAEITTAEEPEVTTVDEPEETTEATTVDEPEETTEATTADEPEETTEITTADEPEETPEVTTEESLLDTLIDAFAPEKQDQDTPEMPQPEETEQTTYISSIALFAGLTAEEALAQTDGADYILDYNFNRQPEGGFAYIGYTLSESREDAVTNLLLVKGRNTDTLSYAGIEYTLLADIDFNRGADKDTPQLYLYYTKDSRAGAPITKIAGLTAEMEDGFEPVTLWSGRRRDRGQSTDETNIYVFRDYDGYTGSVFASGEDSALPDYIVWLVCGGVLVISLTAGIICGWSIKKGRAGNEKV